MKKSRPEESGRHVTKLLTAYINYIYCFTTENFAEEPAAVPEAKFIEIL